MRIEYYICDNCGQRIDEKDSWENQDLKFCCMKCRDALEKTGEKHE